MSLNINFTKIKKKSNVFTIFFFMGMNIYKSLKELKLRLREVIGIMLTEYNLGELQKKNQTKISLIKLLVFDFALFFEDIFCFTLEIFHSLPCW